MKKLRVILGVVTSILLGGCSSFQRERDLELYLVGAALTYAAAKGIVCRNSEYREQCGVAAAAAFVIWY